MNPELWMAMAILAAVSLAVGGVVLWVAGRWGQERPGNGLDVG